MEEGEERHARVGPLAKRLPPGVTSLQVALIALDALLNAQQQGGVPLVQTRDGVKLLHLTEDAERTDTQGQRDMVRFKSQEVG